MRHPALALVVVAAVSAGACQAAPAPAATLQGPAAGTPASVSPAPPQPTPTPSASLQGPSAPEPACPAPTEGTELLTNERYGYCLLVPTGYLQSGPPHELAIAPEGFVFWETPGPLRIGVADAGGRSVGEVADEVNAQTGFSLEPASLTIAGVEAVALDVPQQATVRQVYLVYEDRLYTLGFLQPSSEDGAEAIERFARLYDTVINSFALLPVEPPAASFAPGLAGGGSAVVAYIKDGDLLVWEEATGQSETVYDSGDVIRVELSDDGELAAFVRGNSALWVVGRDGAGASELVSAEALRARLKPAEEEIVELPCLEWIPNTHRLLYSGRVVPPAIGAACHQWFNRGLTLLDADTLVSVELVPPEENVTSVPSPDGEKVAILFSTGPAFVDVDDALAGNVALTRPAGGVPGANGDDSARAWTQDSSALLIRSSTHDRNVDPLFTIWRVPVDGSPVQALVTLRGSNEELAPDGSIVVFGRSTGPGGISARFVGPLPEDLGPLAIVRDLLSLPWSPGGSAFVVGDEELSPLCTNAAQTIEVCGPAVRLVDAVESRSVEWLDRDRFLYVTLVPRRLMLGALDGSAVIIAEDPGGPPDRTDVALNYAGVTSTCTDDSEFVSDVTVPDGKHIAPETLFRKTWRVRNTGTCTWGDGYRLTYLSGDRMSGLRSAPLDVPVEPGEEVDLSVVLVAPNAAGSYRGQWTLFAPDGTPFGTRPYVVIVVP